MEIPDLDPDRPPSAWEERMNRYHSRRGELYASLYGPAGEDALAMDSGAGEQVDVRS